MTSLDKARATQLQNIQAKTGKTLDQLRALVLNSGLTRHAEIRTMLMRELGLGYGDANTLTHFALQSEGQSAAQAAGAATAGVTGQLYSGAMAPLRPIHDRLMAAIEKLGPFEIAPKKGYLSLRHRPSCFHDDGLPAGPDALTNRVAQERPGRRPALREQAALLERAAD